MKKVEIAKNIFWVGKNDDRKVPFHRLILERGTTYNSYLLQTEKPTIIDTVDIAFGREYVENLAGIMDLNRIAYIVINHVEPDHAGALPALAARAKNAVIVSTALGESLLKGMFNLKDRSFLTIKDGDTLDVGGATLKFLETPYLHREETMMTYVVEEEILFPCDVFSTHIANDELFNDLARSDYLDDFKIYYDLIMAPHRPYVRQMLDKIRALDIRMIAPSHGYILRSNVNDFIGRYDQWSLLKPGKRKKVTLAYASMTGNTAKIAGAMARGLEEKGIQVNVLNLKDTSASEFAGMVSESDGLLVGSSTRYGDMVGNTEEALNYIKSVSKGKIAAAFGSFGWSGEAVLHIENNLKESGFQVVDHNYLISHRGIDTPLFPLRVRFLQEDGLKMAEEAGKAFGEIVLTH